ncbi:hypothetical protein L3V83_09150 [Thiotrichales bacterium 19X7-9]|nr:hypothetical protein [Thiotrichales bacterium 19X7-9]TNF66540.1 MAG: hypothetical protein EP298_08800 [Gammaproteobacteria bacterium]UTW43135.1 hypothetical protein KFE69_03035 [bacterium SCSIO 12844]
MTALKVNKHIVFFRNLDYLIEKSENIKNISSLSKAIGCDRSAFVKSRERQSLPKVDIVESCAKIFDVTMESILNDDIEKLYKSKKLHILDSVTGKTIAIESHEFGFVCNAAFRFPSELPSFKDKFVYVQTKPIYNDFSKVVIESNSSYCIKVIRIIDNNYYFTTSENLTSLESQGNKSIVGEIIKTIYKLDY